MNLPNHEIENAYRSWARMMRMFHKRDKSRTFVEERWRTFRLFYADLGPRRDVERLHRSAPRHGFIFGNVGYRFGIAIPESIETFRQRLRKNVLAGRNRFILPADWKPATESEDMDNAEAV